MLVVELAHFVMGFQTQHTKVPLRQQHLVQVHTCKGGECCPLQMGHTVAIGATAYTMASGTMMFDGCNEDVAATAMLLVLRQSRQHCTVA